MKNLLCCILLLLALLFFTRCNTPRHIDKVVHSISLPNYSGANSFQISLIDKVSVKFSSSFYADDIQQINENFIIPLLIYNYWNRDFINFLNLNTDSTTLVKNLQYSLLETLSNSSVREKIDILQVDIESVEMIVPYNNKGYLIPITFFFGSRKQEAIGPTRVSFRLAYKCYHNGLVTENTKDFHNTISAQYHDNMRSPGVVVPRNHVQTAYDVLNDLLLEASIEIREELESEL